MLKNYGQKDVCREKDSNAEFLPLLQKQGIFQALKNNEAVSYSLAFGNCRWARAWQGKTAIAKSSCSMALGHWRNRRISAGISNSWADKTFSCWSAGALYSPPEQDIIKVLQVAKGQDLVMLLTFTTPEQDEERFSGWSGRILIWKIAKSALWIIKVAPVNAASAG